MKSYTSIQCSRKTCFKWKREGRISFQLCSHYSPPLPSLSPTTSKLSFLLSTKWDLKLAMGGEWLGRPICSRTPTCSICWCYKLNYKDGFLIKIDFTMSNTVSLSFKVEQSQGVQHPLFVSQVNRVALGPRAVQDDKQLRLIWARAMRCMVINENELKINYRTSVLLLLSFGTSVSSFPRSHDVFPLSLSAQIQSLKPVPFFPARLFSLDSGSQG